ncbi:MAG TPA: aminoacyl-tRNA hydrolase, partial [bacterium]|nr:aminoacyl-tRNA hydrolase [bacterium]
MAGQHVQTEGQKLQAVIGLGNPGRGYSRTRHNVGYWVVDALARKLGSQPKTRSAVSCAVSESYWDEAGPVVLAKPLTYMNESGKAVKGMISHYKLEPDQFTVVYDDLNLPLGTLRLRAKGSAGGHNGIKSIIETLGTDQFQRVRVGLGGPS